MREEFYPNNSYYFATTDTPIKVDADMPGKRMYYLVPRLNWEKDFGAEETRAEKRYAEELDIRTLETYDKNYREYERQHKGPLKKKIKADEPAANLAVNEQSINIL